MGEEDAGLACCYSDAQRADHLFAVWLGEHTLDDTVLDSNPMLCGGDDLVRFLTSCFQVEGWPHWQGVSFTECPALNPGESHSETYGGRGEYRCFWCGARPFWPVHECECDEPVDSGWWKEWPDLCRSFNESQEPWLFEWNCWEPPP